MLGDGVSLQYLRNVSLVVGTPGGSALQLGALRVVFQVKRGDLETPNTCDVRIYNLSDNTANQLRASKNGLPEFTQLQLSVSYGSQPLAQVFYGSIVQVRIGREDQRNSYVDITAAEGDEPYNFASSAFSLAAGATPMTAVQRLLGDMSRWSYGDPTQKSTDGQGIVLGYIPPSIQNSTTRSIRGRVYYGDCRKETRQLSKSQDCEWSIQNNQLTLIPKTGYIPEPVVLITPGTGLIGVPEQTQTGLKLRVLMNPAIKIGRTIKLDSSNVNQLRYGQDFGSIATNLQLQDSVTKLNADGLYYVMRAEHQGDSRGVPWYTDLTCLAVDATNLPSQVTTSTTISGVITRY